MKEKSIRSAVVNELLRIVLFVVYYIFLIALGLGFFALAAAYTYIIGLLAVNGEWGGINLKVVFLVVMSIVVVWVVAALFGAYLVKPLFAFRKNENKERVEVKEKDCPELFRMIRDLTAKVGCRMPKHVFLSPDVNACVFYNTSFWSIFFPVRKNLEIGLGLFDGMSVEEVKAILGHEFGHFSQDSMKVGSVVYVTNTVLYDLTYAEDGWDRKIDEMCLSDNSWMRYAGGITRALSNLVKRLNQLVYRFVQKGYLTLSRQMEYDADEVACRSVGRNVFVSALYKLDTLSYQHAEFNRLFGQMLQDGKTADGYFVAKDTIRPLVPLFGRTPVMPTVPLTADSAVAGAESRVDVKNVWNTHPSVAERVENLKDQADASAADGRPAWVLIPDEAKKKVSDNMMALIGAAYKDAQPLPAEQLAEEIGALAKDTYMDESVLPFFGRKLCVFDPALPELEQPVENPFNEANKATLMQFQTLVNDYQLLRAVKNKQVDAREAKFDGRIYSRKNLDGPLEQLEKDYDQLLLKVLQIDKDVYAYIRANSSDEQRAQLRAWYDCMAYANYVQGNVLPEITAERNALVNELNRAVRREETEYYKLCKWIVSFEDKIRELIPNLNYGLLAAIADEKLIAEIQAYAQEEHNLVRSIETEPLNGLIRMADLLAGLHDHLYSTARGQISDMAAKLIADR